MKGLISTAESIQTFCETNGWEFSIIGGLALQYWGEQRVTKDVAITLLTGFGDEERYVDALLAEYSARVDDPKEFALRNRVLLLISDGIGIDMSLGALPFEQLLIDRSQKKEYLPNQFLRICSAEDLIVLKAFADRAKDWEDIASVIIKQELLDWKYINEQLAPLVELKETPEILQRLEKCKKENT